MNSQVTLAHSHQNINGIGAPTSQTVRPLSENPAAVYVASLAHGSKRTMHESLTIIAAMLTDGNADALTLDWSALRFQHTAAIRSKLSETYSTATANKMLSALRGVLKMSWRLGHMTAEEYQRAADVQNIQGSTLPAGRALNAGEICALLNACMADPSPAGARDAAVLALLRVGGLRRAEVCALNVEDYNPNDGQLIVRGKRNKERTAYIADGAQRALEDWLAVRGPEPGAIFCPITKSGKIHIRTMHPEAIFFALQKRAKEVGVQDVSPHDLRRTFASDLLDAGADIATVQKMMGHANIGTTARYDRRGEHAKRQAATLLQIPYHAPSMKPQLKSAER